MIQNLLYSMSSIDVKEKLSSCIDSSILHVFAYNYNWNNGFDAPQTIIENSACTLGTALMIFYLADGYRYLTEKNETSEIPEWLAFISGLYNRIYSGIYTDASIAFSVPLTKVQIYKLQKILSEKEQVFITPIDGEDIDLSV